MMNLSFLNLNCRLLKINCIEGKRLSAKKHEGGKKAAYFKIDFDIIQSFAEDTVYLAQISDFPSHVSYLSVDSFCVYHRNYRLS